MTAYSDRFVLVRCPKTGSTYASVVLRQLGKATGRLPGTDAHAPVWAIPDDWKANRKTIGTLRNPWDWYLSYHAHLRRESPAALAGFGGECFRDFLYGATHGQGLPLEGVDLPLPNEQFAGSGLGLASWMQRRFYSDEPPDTKAKGWAVDLLIPTEHLTESLGTLFGADASGWAPRNVTRNRASLDVYDDEMLGWVKAADKRLINTLRWRIGKPCTKRLLRVG